MTLPALKTFVDPVGFMKMTILEDNKSSGRMAVRGIFQRANTQNANGRIYSSDLWERILGDRKMNETLESRRMLGEIEHPTDGTTNLARVSHIITKLERKGNDIIGEAEILNTPAGLIVQELFRSGVQVGISSRGRGTSYVRGGVEYVNEGDFVLETFDFVYKPSTPGAFPELQESVLKDGPFSKGSTMTAKLTELKRIEVRASDIMGAILKKPTNEDLRKLHTECVELDASFQAVSTSLEEADMQAAEDASSKLTEARVAVTSLLDKMHTSNDLDRRIDALETSDKTEGNQDKAVRQLLAECRESRDYFQGRLQEVEALMESSEDELMQRYAAARGLASELLSRLEEADSEIARLTEAHDTLAQRHEAAVSLVAGIAERQDRARIMRRVREAIELHPELKSFSKTLLSCKTESEVDERLTELTTALNLPQHDVDEIAETQVNLGAALAQDETEDETEEEATIGESSGESLPSFGTRINEDDTADDKALIESAANSDPLLASVLSMRNWN